MMVSPSAAAAIAPWIVGKAAGTLSVDAPRTAAGAAIQAPREAASVPTTIGTARRDGWRRMIGSPRNERGRRSRAADRRQPTESRAPNQPNRRARAPLPGRRLRLADEALLVPRRCLRRLHRPRAR